MLSWLPRLSRLLPRLLPLLRGLLTLLRRLLLLLGELPRGSLNGRLLLLGRLLDKLLLLGRPLPRDLLRVRVRLMREEVEEGTRMGGAGVVRGHQQTKPDQSLPTS